MNFLDETTLTTPPFENGTADLGLVHLARVPVAPCGAGAPGAAAPGAAAPCVILLHGLAQNEEDMTGIARLLDPRLLVIVVRGPRAFGRNQYGWFQVRISPEGPVINLEHQLASRKLLADFIDALPQAYDVDPERVWIAGFSQGGIMSAAVALAQPEKVRGFGLLSGRIPPETVPMIARGQALEKLSGFVSHGVQDGVLGIDCGRNTHRLLTERGVRHVYREYEGEHALTDSMQADFSAWISAQIDDCA
ncbi:MAG: alpha/beta fold hydrolase [Pseudomonadota bacterium]